MSERRNILIVDSDVAFSTLLQDYLERFTSYSIVCLRQGPAAVRAAATREFDLAIIDLGLYDEDGVDIARQLRQLQPDIRLILVPLEDGLLPPDAAGLDVQGVLSKPFFLPDLPGRLAEVLALPVKSLPLRSDNLPQPREQLALDANSIEVSRTIGMLSMELNADAVLLTADDRSVAHVGRLSDDEAGTLAHAVADGWRTSVHVAEILGREMLKFEQSLDGGEYLLYSLAIHGNLILSAAVPPNMPLGIIRHRAKKTAKALTSLLVKEMYD
ncbi:MAG: response regulator [Chloroflexi bacterium]|nr:response regulator [Chloroflexota bacterium]